MATALELDLNRLQSRAFDRAEWAEQALQRYHEAAAKLGASRVQPLRGLYQWMFVPITLWPFNIQDVLEDCLTVLEKGKRLNSRYRLIIELLPEPPDEAVCAAVADHELHVQKGTYENLLKTQAKYAQNELAIKNSPELRLQWVAIKAAFDVRAYQDYKGVVRRGMTIERNLRLPFHVDLRRRDDAFHAAFDAFCLRWNLYGMQYDEPLPLKLAVNLTPYGTMIHIPSYWSFDPKRDIRWDAIAKLHRIRVSGRQGAALAKGIAERIQNVALLQQLDQEVHRLGLKGEKKHEYICRGLGWDSRTSSKRISRLRAELKKYPK
jgi:hypothetical protein